jgi:hypothetical protein
VAAHLSRRLELLGGSPYGLVAAHVAVHARRAREIPGPPAAVRLFAATVVALGVGSGSGAASGEGLRSSVVPKTLADGSRPARLPAALRRYRSLPVVGARAIPANAAILRRCPPDPSLRGRRKLAGAWLSTDGLSVGYYVKGTPPLFACDAARLGSRLRRCTGAASPVRDPDRLAKAGGSLAICRAARPLAFMWIAPPAAAAWALVDHASYWVAYRTPRSRLLRISGTKGVNPQGSFRARIAFLRLDGRLLREETVRGSVAG